MSSSLRFIIFFFKASNSNGSGKAFPEIMGRWKFSLGPIAISGFRLATNKGQNGISYIYDAKEGLQGWRYVHRSKIRPHPQLDWAPCREVMSSSTDDLGGQHMAVGVFRANNIYIYIAFCFSSFYYLQTKLDTKCSSQSPLVHPPI